MQGGPTGFYTGNEIITIEFFVLKRLIALLVPPDDDGDVRVPLRLRVDVLHVTVQRTGPQEAPLLY